MLSGHTSELKSEIKKYKSNFRIWDQSVEEDLFQIVDNQFHDWKGVKCLTPSIEAKYKEAKDDIKGERKSIERRSCKIHQGTSENMDLLYVSFKEDLLELIYNYYMKVIRNKGRKFTPPTYNLASS